MALEGSTDIDEESRVVDEFATYDEWGGGGHVGVVCAVATAALRAQWECIEALAADRAGVFAHGSSDSVDVLVLSILSL